jgi:signal transduction histidine kinase
MDVIVDALRTLLLTVALRRVHQTSAAAPQELRSAWQWVRIGAVLLLFGSLADTLSDILKPGPLGLPLWLVEQAIGYGAGLMLVLWGGVRLLSAAADMGAAAARAREALAEAARQAALQRAAEADRRVSELEAQLTSATEAKQRLEEASRASSLFLARMSHELRQPLTTVVGFSDVLKSEVFGPIGNSRYREYVSGILTASRDLSLRLSDLLDLCTIEAGELALHDEQVEPRDLVAGCLQMFGQIALQRGCLLEFDVDPRLPQIRADPRRLKQIVANLLDDAIDRCGEGAAIAVAARLAAAGGVSLTVRDPGVAVDVGAENHRALARALARSLAELHQGRLVWRRVGDGNEAELWLPPHRVLAHAAVR